MMWKLDEQVEAARRAPGWGEFHRACSRHNLFFDHIERAGKRGPYQATAYTLEQRGGAYVTVHLAGGQGATPIAALASAYQGAGKPVADQELGQLVNPVGATIDMEDLLG